MLRVETVYSPQIGLNLKPDGEEKKGEGREGLLPPASNSNQTLASCSEST